MESNVEILNINVGVLGHVDSGKTAFCAAVSTILSTAALDKSPQSQERGITQDLQFSAFRVPKFSNSLSTTSGENHQNINVVNAAETIPSNLNSSIVFNFTLVDCPGHAGLIRTIIGGASIIDVVLLVIDVTKGIQTQTAEGIVVAEVATPHLLIILNKIDLIPPNDRESKLSALKSRIKKVLQNSRFVKSIPQERDPIGSFNESISSTPSLRELKFIPFSAKPSDGSPPIGIEELHEALSRIELPSRFSRLKSSNPPSPDDFLMSIDHCFQIKGQGSVATGTLLKGSLATNQLVELVGSHASHKVKSMQVFKSKVDKVYEGDRVGVLLPSLNAAEVERGLLASPGSVPFADHLVVTIHKIRYYKPEITSSSKMHITIGHSTSMAKLTLFGNPNSTFSDPSQLSTSSSSSSSSPISSLSISSHSDETSVDFTKDYSFIQSMNGVERCFAILELEKPLPVPKGSIYIASKLDADINTPSCRLGFHGIVLNCFDLKTSTHASSSSTLSSKGNTALTNSNTTVTKSSSFHLGIKSLDFIKIFKYKMKSGEVDRIQDGSTLIVKNLFKKETNMKLWIGMKVELRSEDDLHSLTDKPALNTGTIESSFGSSGKVKIRLDKPASSSDQSVIVSSKVILRIKKFINHGLDQIGIKQ